MGAFPKAFFSHLIHSTFCFSVPLVKHQFIYIYVTTALLNQALEGSW